MTPLHASQIDAACRAAVACRLFTAERGGVFTEPGFFGYKPATLSTWDVTSEDGVAFHPAVGFTFVGGKAETVVGAFLTDAHGRCLDESFVVTFPEPFEFSRPDDTLEVMPRIVVGN